MKIFLLAQLMVIIFSGCIKDAELYFENIRFKPSSYQQIVGIYSTGPNYSGTLIKLYKDSTFQYNTWSEIRDTNDKDKVISGKYLIFGDSLFLISNPSANNFSKNSEIILSLKYSYFQDPYLFLNIDNNIYLMDSRYKYNYLRKYFFMSNLERDIIRDHPKKIEEK